MLTENVMRSFRKINQTNKQTRIYIYIFKVRLHEEWDDDDDDVTQRLMFLFSRRVSKLTIHFEL